MSASQSRTRGGTDTHDIEEGTTNRGGLTLTTSSTRAAACCCVPRDALARHERGWPAPLPGLLVATTKSAAPRPARDEREVTLELVASTESAAPRPYRGEREATLKLVASTDAALEPVSMAVLAQLSGSNGTGTHTQLQCRRGSSRWGCTHAQLASPMSSTAASSSTTARTSRSPPRARRCVQPSGGQGTMAS